MSNVPRVLGIVIFALALCAQAPNAGVKDRSLTPVRLGTADELKMPVHIPRGYAVVIGVSNYKNLGQQGNLSYAEKDAENLSLALISKEAGNIEFQNVKKLIGPQATLENIRNALEVWLPSQAQETDRVVVFFVGHGVTDANGRGYFAPYDIDPKHVADTAYSMTRLGEVFSKSVKARWKMLLTDACHSGKLTVDTTDAKVNESLRGLPQGFLTLTSSRASERSYEDAQLAGGNGVFSYFLVRGWQGEADVDPRDGVVTADELVTYVKREVRAYAKSRGAQQTPLEFGDFPDDMILGYNPNRREQLAATLPQLSNGSLIIEANLADTEVYIDEKLYGKAAPGMPLRVPGLASGSHKIRGVRTGYDPASVEVNVVPGAEQTVSLRLLYQRSIKPGAKVLYDQGETIWLRAKASPVESRKAADFFARALKEDGNYSQAALELCRVKQALGETAAALKSCQKALEIDPSYVDARTATGTLLMESGDYPEAVRQLQQASIEDAHNSLVLSILAEAYYLADHAKEAEDAATRALALDPTSSQAFFLRGEARRSQKRFDEAIEDYNQALHTQEFTSGALRTVTFWAIGTGMQKHRSGYQNLYRSRKADAYYGLCAAEMGRENFPRAMHACEESLKVDRDDPDTHLLLAQCYAEMYNRDSRKQYLIEARTNIEATLRTNPDIQNAASLQRKVKEITELLASAH